MKYMTRRRLGFYAATAGHNPGPDTSGCDAAGQGLIGTLVINKFGGGIVWERPGPLFVRWR